MCFQYQPNHCQLCLTNTATQTGSHLLSAFLIESMVGKRGQEKSHIINASANFDYRKDVGAEPIVEDYILCRGCEQRMAYLESYISREYRDKIKSKQFQQNFEVQFIPNTPYYISRALRVSSEAFLLFICTVIFRLSISSKPLFVDFKLRPHEQEKLRAIIHEALPDYVDFKVSIKNKEWLKVLRGQTDIFQGLHYVVATYSQLEDPTTSFVFAHPDYRFAYNFMFNQVLVLFFFEKPRNNEVILDFFGLTNGLVLEEIANNHDNNVKTLIVSEDKWREMLNVPKRLLVKQKIEGIFGEFISEFIQKNDAFPTQRDWITYVNINFPND